MATPLPRAFKDGLPSFFFYLVSSLRRWLPRSVPRIVGFILLLFDLGFLFDFASRWLGKQRPNERIDCHKRNICLPIAEPSSADLERSLSLSLSLFLSFSLFLTLLLSLSYSFIRRNRFFVSVL